MHITRVAIAIKRYDFLENTHKTIDAG